MIWNWPSGLRAIASQSEAVFSRFQKCTHFATSEVVIFGNFFSKCCHMKTNTDKDMKPTAYGSKYPKFLLEEISYSLCQTPLKPRKFKVRTEVEVGSPIFSLEIFPYLKSSLVTYISTWLVTWICYWIHSFTNTRVQKIFIQPPNFAINWHNIAYKYCQMLVDP